MLFQMGFHKFKAAQNLYQNDHYLPTQISKNRRAESGVTICGYVTKACDLQPTVAPLDPGARANWT